MVHSVDNIEGHFGSICNCCGCCCVFLNTKKKMGLLVISSSNYLAEVEEDNCVGCGTCEERCPMEAITVGDKGTAAINEEVCIGAAASAPQPAPPNR